MVSLLGGITLDNGLPFWPHGIISENKVFQIVYPHQIKEHIKLVNHNHKNPLTIKQQRFADLSQKINTNDNPIIMIVELKK